MNYLVNGYLCQNFIKMQNTNVSNQTVSSHPDQPYRFIWQAISALYISTFVSNEEIYLVDMITKIFRLNRLRNT